MNCIGVVGIMVLFCRCTTTVDSSLGRFHPSPRVKEILAWPDDSGSVYYQARQFDGLDYRATLSRAAHGDAQALSRLFVYTKSGSLTGEGSLSHMDALGELLKQWGDRDYARVLRQQPVEVIGSVASALNEFWGHAGWPKGEYPTTQSLCARSTSVDTHSAEQ